MGASIIAIIQFDRGFTDDWFTSGSSVWDLSKDAAFFGCKDYNFIGAISGIRLNGPNAHPLPLRGVPKELNEQFLEMFAPFDDTTGWLYLWEILELINFFEVRLEELDDAVLNVVDVMQVLVARYGKNRVRLVFAILD